MHPNLISTASFAELRCSHGSYVDKTGFLETFLQEPGSALFLRPRGFGKTLFLSMLAEFFDIGKDSRDLFQGLAIAANRKLCDAWMNKYPVLSLDLRIGREYSFRHASAALATALADTCARHNALLTSSRVTPRDRMLLEAVAGGQASRALLGRALLVLSRALADHHGRPVILLVDQYDFPLATAAEEGYYEEMLALLRDLFSSVLTANPCLAFALFTGCLPMPGASFAASLNMLDCHDGADLAYADLFAFTHSEVDRLLADANLADKKDEVVRWYGGYGPEQSLFCPSSVLSYVRDHLRDPQARPRNYWMELGNNDICKGLGTYIPHLPLGYITHLWHSSPSHPSSIPVRLDRHPDYRDFYQTNDAFWTLLFAAGFVAPSRETNTCYYDPDPAQTVLSTPNQDVWRIIERATAELYTEFASRGKYSRISGMAVPHRLGDIHLRFF